MLYTEYLFFVCKCSLLLHLTIDISVVYMN